VSRSQNNHSQKIPFLDLVTPHLALEQELTAVFQQVLRSAGFIGGPMVDNFEAEFAAFCKTERAIAVNSGTDALRFALMAVGVKPGDVVITVPHTFIATTEAISQVGAIPEFVDIDERTYNMDPVKLAQHLETRCSVNEDGKLISLKNSGPVAAIVPVHLYGQMADMDAILALAEKFDLLVVEDACQAHGAEYFSRKHERWFSAGSMGKAAAFSFYPGKNLGACGEGGAITTSDSSIADACKMIRDHGQAKKYYHDIEGYNGRLDSIQTGILSVKLKHLAAWNQARQERAAQYNRLLGSPNAGIRTPYEPSWSRAIYHLYVVRTDERERLMAHLADAGIGTGIHYPIPLHRQKAYRWLGYSEGDFPVTEKVVKEIVSLPMYPQLTPAQQEQVAERIVQFATQSGLEPASALG
jgi:dTDP-4-amino-4,6-dideoxygalactose transaminase